MRAWARRRSPHVVERLILRVNEERLAGNDRAVATTAMYNSLLEAWCRCDGVGGETSAVSRAGEILDLMQRNAVEAEAEAAAEEEEESGGKGGGAESCSCAPDARSYNVVIKALARRGDIEGTESLLRRADSFGLATMRGYNLLLAALSRAGEAERAEAALRRARDEIHLRPDANSYNQILAAWERRAGDDPSSPDRAQAVFDEISASAAESAGARPDTGTYNRLMACWHKSDRADAHERVEEIFLSMESDLAAGNFDARPDLTSVNTALSSIAKARGGRGGSTAAAPEERARDIWDRSRDEYGVRPDTLGYNLMIKILSGSGADDAPDRAEALLADMEDQVAAGDERVMPDAFTYLSVITVITKGKVRGGGGGGNHRGRRAQAVLRRMDRLARTRGGVRPTTPVFNALINAWAESPAGDRRGEAVRRAEAILSRMEDGAAAGDAACAPDARTYNSVLKLLSRNAAGKGGDGARRADRLLIRMEASAARGGEGGKKGGDAAAAVALPDSYSYTAVISAYAHSSERNKARRAQAVLLRMIESYDEGRGNPSARPNAFAFNACLNACAHTRAREERVDAFLAAVAVLLLLQKYGAPDETTFGTFLRVCSAHMPDDDDRRRSLVRTVFVRCRRDGMVGEMVLEQMQFAAGPDLFKELVGFNKEDGMRGAPGLDMLPPEWKRNVRGRKR